MEALVRSQQSARSLSGIESRAAALERFLERRQAWVLALWSLVYFVGTMVRAQAYPFWYDELLTVLGARQSTLSAALHALRDADWMPPANHVTFYLTDKLLGHGEVGFRVPAMIGFWIFSICMFFFARRRVSILFALTAMILPYASSFQAYSFQARAYAMVLGFGAVALVSWQAAADGAARPWSLLGVAAGIAGAIAFHYWAVLIYLPLGGAEIYRSFRRRRIDWPVWAAFVAGAISLVVLAPIILHGLRDWAPHGAQVYPRMYWNFYQIEFRVFFTFALPLACCLTIWLLLGGRREKPAGARNVTIPDHEWLAAALFFVLPIAAVSIALASPHQVFAMRYAVLAVCGYALLGAFVAARLAAGRAAVGVACMLASLAPFTYLMTNPGDSRTPFEKLTFLRPALEHEVVVSDVFIPQFVEIWYYAPARLKSRFVYLGQDGSETKGWPYLGEFAKVGLPIAAYRDFDVPGKSFLLYTFRFGDFQKVLRDHGIPMQQVASWKEFKLVRVHIPDGGRRASVSSVNAGK